MPPHLAEQVRRGIEILQKRYQADKFLAYFQAATNTYAPAAKLKKLYDEALDHPQIAGLAIGTRPDCLPDDILNLIETYARDRYVCLELGLQTIHDRSLDWMNRGHHFDAFVDAVERCRRLRFAPAPSSQSLNTPDAKRKRASVSGLDLCAHVILGLPGESRDILIAGHYPHLPRLLALLLSAQPAVDPGFPLHGVVALATSDGVTWKELWRVQ